MPSKTKKTDKREFQVWGIGDHDRLTYQDKLQHELKGLTKPHKQKNHLNDYPDDAKAQIIAIKTMMGAKNITGAYVAEALGIDRQRLIAVLSGAIKHPNYEILAAAHEIVTTAQKQALTEIEAWQERREKRLQFSANAMLFNQVLTQAKKGFHHVD